MTRLLGPTATIHGDIAAVVAAASRAPSIHNTQPWRWTFDGQVLELRADRTRQLHVADRDGHSLLVSCGAAVELTAVALRAQGWAAPLELTPEATDPDLLARFTLTGRGGPDEQAAVELAASARRRSDRRVYGPHVVPADVVERLRVASASSVVLVHFPTRADEKLDLAVAISAADTAQRDDAAYAAEMASWRRVGTGAGADDGIPDTSIPQVPAGHPRHTDVPLRDFEAGVAGGQLITADVDERPVIAVICTGPDRPLDRLNAGRAMMRLMIEAELEGLSSCPLSQSVDLLAFRTRLQTLMSWTGHPQMMVRLGERPAGEPAARTPRRAVDDVLTTT